MGDRWTKIQSSPAHTTRVSFCLGFTGGVLALVTGNYAFRERITFEMGAWRDAMLTMRRRLEVSGGVPYLVRDQDFIALMGQLPRPRYRRRYYAYDAFKLEMQHGWNQLIMIAAASLNDLLAKRYD